MRHILWSIAAAAARAPLSVLLTPAALAARAALADWAPAAAAAADARLLVESPGAGCLGAPGAQAPGFLEAEAEVGDGVVYLLQRRASASSQLRSRPSPGAQAADTGRLVHKAQQSGQEKRRSPGARFVVWVHAPFPRSGSSVVLSLIEVATLDPSQNGLFALFEPCHPGDRVASELASCGQLLLSLLHCNFTGVEQLWGWSNPHSLHWDAITYTPAAAEHSCGGASLVAFKTIVEGLAAESFRLLQQVPDLHLVDVVRDPRGVLASWKTTRGFQAHLKNATGPDALRGICDGLAQSLNVTAMAAATVGPRVHRVVFEDLVRHPEATARQLYRAIGLTFGQQQQRWLQQMFDAGTCMAEGPFVDCRRNSTARIEAWRTELAPEELEAFRAHPRCREVSEAYGYPPF